MSDYEVENVPYVPKKRGRWAQLVQDVHNQLIKRPNDIVAVSLADKSQCTAVYYALRRYFSSEEAEKFKDAIRVSLRSNVARVYVIPEGTDNE